MLLLPFYSWGNWDPHGENVLCGVIGQVSGEALVQTPFSRNPLPKPFPIILPVKTCVHQLNPSVLQTYASPFIKLAEIGKWSLRSFQWFSFQRDHQKDEFTHHFHAWASCKHIEFWGYYSLPHSKKVDQYLCRKAWPATGRLSVPHSMELVAVYMHWRSRAQSTSCTRYKPQHGTPGLQAWVGIKQWD